MNILLTNHYAGSSKHGMAMRPFYLAKEWQRLGHEVTIVAASQSHVRAVEPELNGTLTEEMVDGIRYVWVETPPYKGNGLKRAVNMLTFCGRIAGSAGRLARDYRPDVVIASSNYPLDGAPAHRVARKAGARFLVEVHDLWPLTPIEVGGVSPGHPFMRLLQWGEDYGYRHADRVVSMLPCAEEHMRGRGMAPGKFVYIPNGVDVSEWENDGAPLPEEHAAAIERLKDEGRFLVGYAGAHGLCNALDSLVHAAELLRTEPVAFVLVGQGPEKEGLEKLAAERGLENVLFLRSVPKRAVPRLLTSMDALFIGLKKMSLFRFGISPNKLMDYMMAARPVIQAIEAGNDPATESGSGVSIPPEDPKAIARAVCGMMSMDPSERAAMGLRGREYVLANHDYRVLAQRFVEVMR